MRQVTTVPSVGQGYIKFIYITEISSANLIIKRVNGFVKKKVQTLFQKKVDFTCSSVIYKLKAAELIRKKLKLF